MSVTPPNRLSETGALAPVKRWLNSIRDFLVSCEVAQTPTISVERQTTGQVVNSTAAQEEDLEGVSLRFRGAWSAGEKYLRGDIVAHPTFNSTAAPNNDLFTEPASEGQAMVGTFVCIREHTSGTGLSARHPNTPLEYCGVKEDPQWDNDKALSGLIPQTGQPDLLLVQPESDYWRTFIAPPQLHYMQVGGWQTDTHETFGGQRATILYPTGITIGAGLDANMSAPLAALWRQEATGSDSVMGLHCPYSYQQRRNELAGFHVELKMKNGHQNYQDIEALTLRIRETEIWDGGVKKRILMLRSEPYSVSLYQE